MLRGLRDKDTDKQAAIGCRTDSHKGLGVGGGGAGRKRALGKKRGDPLGVSGAKTETMSHSGGEVNKKKRGGREEEKGDAFEND